MGWLDCRNAGQRHRGRLYPKAEPGRPRRWSTTTLTCIKPGLQQACRRQLRGPRSTIATATTALSERIRRAGRRISAPQSSCTVAILVWNCWITITAIREGEYGNWRNRESPEFLENGLAYRGQGDYCVICSLRDSLYGYVLKIFVLQTVLLVYFVLSSMNVNIFAVFKILQEWSSSTSIMNYFMNYLNFMIQNSKFLDGTYNYRIRLPLGKFLLKTSQRNWTVLFCFNGKKSIKIVEEGFVTNYNIW